MIIENTHTQFGGPRQTVATVPGRREHPRRATRPSCAADLPVGGWRLLAQTLGGRNIAKCN